MTDEARIANDTCAALGAPTGKDTSVAQTDSKNWQTHLDRVRPGIWLALTILAVMCVYLSALPGEFVWDDVPLLGGVKHLLAKGSIWQLFKGPFWPLDEANISTRLYYRPLTTFTFATDYLIHHENSAGYRVSNLAFHLVNTTLLFSLVRRTGARSWVAALLTCGWALQPRLAESIAWISGRTDLLATTFVLLSLVVWRTTWKHRTLASASLLLGLLCKEVALAGSAAIIVLELSNTDRHKLQRWLQTLYPLAAVGVYLALRSYALRGQTTQSEGILESQRPLLVFDTLGRYAAMLIDPWNPRTQIGDVQETSKRYAVLGFLVLIALVWLARRVILRGATYARATLALFGTSLLLVLHVVPISVGVSAADRFLYLPTAALVWWASFLFVSLRAWQLASVSILVASLVPMTVRRAVMWADPVALWTDACGHPDSRSMTSLMELGNLEFNAGNIDRAYRIYGLALRYPAKWKEYPDRGATNLALAAMRLGRYQEGKILLNEITHFRPEVPKYWYDLATAQIRLLDYVSARKSLERAILLMPQYEDALATRKSLPYFESLTSRMQQSSVSQAEKAGIFTALGQFREAEMAWLGLLRIDSTSLVVQKSALAFVMQYGTNVGVEGALETASRWKSHAPSLYVGLRNRLSQGRRLRLVPLQNYGVLSPITG